MATMGMRSPKLIFIPFEYTFLLWYWALTLRVLDAWSLMPRNQVHTRPLKIYGLNQSKSLHVLEILKTLLSLAHVMDLIGWDPVCLMGPRPLEYLTTVTWPWWLSLTSPSPLALSQANHRHYFMCLIWFTAKTVILHNSLPCCASVCGWCLCNAGWCLILLMLLCVRVGIYLYIFFVCTHTWEVERILAKSRPRSLA